MILVSFSQYQGKEIEEDIEIQAIYDFVYKSQRNQKVIDGSIVAVTGEIPESAVVEIEDASYTKEYEEKIL